MGTFTPMHSEKARAYAGVCDHPNFGGAYTKRTEMIQRVGAMKVPRIRGMYVGNALSNETADALRAFGGKWCMTVWPTESGLSDADLKTRIQKIATNHADVCVAIEGPNEWNNSRAGGTPMGASEATRVQKIIYQTIRSYPQLAHVVVLGPSAHVIVLTRNNGRDYLDLRTAGIKPYMDAMAVHHYSSGSDITTKLDERLGWLEAAFPGLKCWITECGWATGGSGGNIKVTEAEQSLYAMRTLFFLAPKDIPYSQYEFLETELSSGGDGYGVYKCTGTEPSTWTKKQEVDEFGAILSALADPGPAYTSVPVSFTCTDTGVNKFLTQKRTGVTTAWFYTKLPKDTPRSVSYTDKQGKRTITVGPKPVGVQLR